MKARGKEVVYTLHVLDKLFREDHLDIINNILRTGKWAAKRKGIYKVTSRNGVVLVVKELPDRFKVITIGGKYEEIYKM
ncbi:MAG: hypothetical protein HYW25_03605 [Candidatus Aenigmarchaeota archaeon]|nr:hypothetical protein [Candidatus Aenigmarchaeota archaeon]